MKTSILAALAALFVLGGSSQLWAHDFDHDDHGYWDEHHHYRHYDYYHHQRGYWQERDGVRIFISL